MHITLVSGHKKNWHAGASKVYLQLHKDMQGRGHEICLYNNEDYVPASTAGPMRKFFTALLLKRNLYEKVKNDDVVDVAGNYGWSLFTALKRLPRNQRPLLVSRLHGLEFLDERARIDQEISGCLKLSWQYKNVTRRWLNWQERQTIEAADVVICHTTREVDAIVCAGWKSERQIRYVPLGLDDEFMGHVSPTQGSGSKLLWWGSWIERKGITDVSRGFALAHSQNPELTLTIGASGSDPQSVLRWFPSAARSAVSVLPFVSHDEHMQILSSHDILLFPSLSEGFGLALLEAMAAGLPAITTFTGLAHDWLESGYNCLLVPMNGSTSLARAILRLSSDQVLRIRLAENAAKLATELTAARAAERSLEVYLEHYSEKDHAEGHSSTTDSFEAGQYL